MSARDQLPGTSPGLIMGIGMRKFVFAIALLAALCGCATPYQSSGFLGGFTETQINAQTFEISFGGNAFTSSTRTGNLALLRASEIALANGYPYFVVLDKSTDITNVAISSPGTAETNGQFGPMGTFTATTTYHPPQTNNFEKPTSRIVIVLVADQSYQGVTYYDAALISKSLKQTYGIK